MDANSILSRPLAETLLGCDGSETPLRGSIRELVILQHVLQHTLLFNLYKKNPTLQEINISHLGKRKIIFKYALWGGYVNSLEGIYDTILRQFIWWILRSFWLFSMFSASFFSESNVFWGYSRQIPSRSWTWFFLHTNRQTTQTRSSIVTNVA